MDGPLPGSVFRSLVHFAPDGFLVVGRDGVIIFANAQSEGLFGYSREELIGSPVERLLPERFRADHVELRSRYARAPRPRPMGSRMELKARRRDNSEFDVEISLAPVYTDDGMLVSVTVRDVSEQRDLESERRHLLAEAEIERERNRIAGDLHDGVMQAMYSVGLQLTSFLHDANAVTPEERERITTAIQELNGAIGDVRRYVQDLHRRRRWNFPLGQDHRLQPRRPLRYRQPRQHRQRARSQ
ncbi:MAG: PAS domain S-box protein [Dehalococcoidia bacterium]